jgi:hypothetical protein
MRRFRMVDMCKGKRKLWLQGTDDVLVVGLHIVGIRMKVSSLNNVTSLPYTLFFFSFTWFIPLIFLLLPPLFSFSFSFILSFSYLFSFFLYFSTFFISFFLSFFLFHTHTFLFILPSLDNFSKLSTPLFLACIQSEILNKSC